MWGGLNPLGVAAMTLYLGVALACTCAAIFARPPRGHRWHRYAWLGLAILFVVMVCLRLFDIEEIIRNSARDALREQGRYSTRREVQAIIAAIVLAGVAAFGLTLAVVKGSKLRGRRNQAVMVAIGTGGALVLLIVLRLVSFHAIDALLYGPLKLNWIGDIGGSLIVAAGAIYYAARVRRMR